MPVYNQTINVETPENFQLSIPILKPDGTPFIQPSIINEEKPRKFSLKTLSNSLMNSVGNKKFQGFSMGLNEQNHTNQDMIAYNQVKKIPHVGKDKEPKFSFFKMPPSKQDMSLIHGLTP